MKIKDSFKSQEKANSYSDGSWTFFENIMDSIEEADAVVVLTEWEEYSTLDWDSISEKMRSPGWVFDSRSIVSRKKVIDSGLRLWRIGDGFNN